MGFGDFSQLAGQFGQTGLFIGYLIWRELRTDARNLAYNQSRLECDRAIAAALGALKAVIERMDR